MSTYEIETPSDAELLQTYAVEYLRAGKENIARMFLIFAGRVSLREQGYVLLADEGDTND